MGRGGAGRRGGEGGGAVVELRGMINVNGGNRIRSREGGERVGGGLESKREDGEWEGG